MNIFQLKSIFSPLEIAGKLGSIAATGTTVWMLQCGTANAATWELTRTFLNPTPAALEQFGYSVALSGNHLLIGAPRAESDTGAAYLFDATTGNLLRSFFNPTPSAIDFFGFSVAISGNNVLIGSYLDDAGGTDVGTAYLFDATTGNLLRAFLNPTPAPFDGFGNAVAISGNNVLVAALGDDTGATNAGSAYLFDATTGNLLQTFLNPTPAPDDRFGQWSVAISNNYVLVGTDFDDTGATNSGAAYLFDATTGNLLRAFLNPTPATDDRFGRSVALSGNYVLVGAGGDDTRATDAGAAYLFDATTGDLLRTFFDSTPITNNQFGNSVALNGNNALISSLLDDTGATDAGAVSLFDVTTGNLRQSFFNPTPATSDLFGISVAISGNNVLVGAHLDDTGADNAGAAYLFQSVDDPSPSVPEGDNVVGLAFLAGGYALKRLISRILKR